jgi:hypothetical protein
VVFVDSKVVAERRDVGLRRPHDIDTDVQGRFHLVDPVHDRILILDRALKPVRVLAGAPYRFNEPKIIAFDERG